jgi:hypothetical protein
MHWRTEFDAPDSSPGAADRHMALNRKVRPRTDRLAKDGLGLCADDQSVAECQTCGGSFDECAYQVIVWGLGSFDSVECAEKAMQRQARRAAAAATLAAPPSESTTPARAVGAALDDRKKS